MTIILTAEQEAEVMGRVASGEYPSNEAVIEEALAALRAQEAVRRAALVADIQAGLASLEAGQGRAVTATELLDELRAKRAAG